MPRDATPPPHLSTPLASFSCAGLWADALLLSSHMDAETWRAVMAQFAARTLAPGAPLRTLYSLFAGAGAAVFDADAVSGADVGAALGARWRLNLTMMLANPTAGDTEVRRPHNRAHMRTRQMLNVDVSRWSFSADLVKYLSDEWAN